MGYRLGIDLGTTFTAAAYIEDAEPRMLELGRRQVSVPSVLLVAEDGTLLIGEAAERRAASEPDRVIREFKRRFGDEVPLVVAGHTFTPVELQTEVLRWVLEHAEQRLPPMREHAVVTHPANWGPYKLRCMRDLLAEAGVTSATLCAEPVAAAIDFAASRAVPVGARLAIYDLGGGTFDVAVVERSAAGFGLLGTPLGVDHLGGSDFDEALFAGTLDRLGVQGLDQDDPDVARGLIALRRECIEAKEALSTDVSTQISSLLPGAVRTVRFSRREFEELIRPGLDESIATTSRALRLAGVAVAELDAVVLVGGSSRIPLVTELLTREFSVPVVLDTYPKNTIALGAARHAKLAGPATKLATGSASVLPAAAVRNPTAPVTPPPPREPTVAPPRQSQLPSPAVEVGPIDVGGVVEPAGARRRPRWILPVIIATTLGLIVTGIVLVTRPDAPQTGVVAAPPVTTAASPVASPSRSASPSTPPPPADPSLPTGPPIPASVVMVPMRTSKDPDARRQLRLIDTAGADRTVVLKSTKGGYTNPTVQPSRTTILLRRDVTLWVMSSDGKDGRHLERRTAGGCRSVVGVSWSPADPNVMVIACQIGESNRSRLLVIDIDGKLIRKLATGKHRTGDDVTISPDGRKALFWATEEERGDGGALYTINVDGSGEPKRVTTGTKGRDGDPAWSPDGRLIAFRRLPLKGPSDSDVFVMSSDGTDQRKLADTGAEDMKPVWSPDGERLLIVSNRKSAHGSDGKAWGLWLINADDGKALRQIGPSAPEITTPTWVYR